MILINTIFWHSRFHLLSDFDEGKRSCRRKLEKHNKRRRRKPGDSRNVVEKELEAEGDPLTDVNCNGKPEKGMTIVLDSSFIVYLMVMSYSS